MTLSLSKPYQIPDPGQALCLLEVYPATATVWQAGLRRASSVWAAVATSFVNHGLQKKDVEAIAAKTREVLETIRIIRQGVNSG